MEYQEKTYLSTRNILLIIASWISLIFICPSGNLWLTNSTEFKDNWVLYFSTEIIFVMLFFSFTSIIDKKYKQTIVFSLLGASNFILTLLYIFILKLPTIYIPFFHPVTLSLAIPLLIHKKYKYAIIGYIVGYFLSFLPLIGSIAPLLFFHLWLNSSSSLVIASKTTRFLIRVFMYYVLSLVIYMLFLEIGHPEIRFIPICFSKTHEILNLFLAVITIYYILNQYLKDYYSRYGDRTLKFLSYFPILWIIPLFEIIIKGKEKH